MMMCLCEAQGALIPAFPPSSRRQILLRRPSHQPHCCAEYFCCDESASRSLWYKVVIQSYCFFQICRNDRKAFTGFADITQCVSVIVGASQCDN